MTKVLVEKYQLKSLKPGFLVITYQTKAPIISIPEWEELKKIGWSGGIILHESINVESIDDHTMNQMGWMRIPGQTPSSN